MSNPAALPEPPATGRRRPLDSIVWVCSEETASSVDAQRGAQAPQGTGARFVEIPDPWLSAGADIPALRAPGAIDVPHILADFDAWMDIDIGDGQASPLTLAAYHSDVRAHLQWLVESGVTSLRSITLDNLKAYRAALIKAYAITTVRRKLASIRRFYGLACSHGAIPVNPSLDLTSPRDRTQRADRIKYLELPELARLIAATSTARTQQLAIRDRAIITLMAYHGLRRCEIRRLDIADIDLAGAQSGRLRIQCKGDKQRIIDLIDETATDITHWLAVRRLLAPAGDACFIQMHWNTAGPLGRLSDRAINSILDGYLTATGLKKRGISCHTLRHTCGTQSLAAGADLLAIRDLLGHVSVDTTSIYARIVDRQRLNPATKLATKTRLNSRS